MTKISILGAGAWGTALAQAQAYAGRDVILWGRSTEVLRQIEMSHENKAYLPDVPLSPRIHATYEIKEALRAQIILLAVPTQMLRGLMGEITPLLSHKTALVVCSKGIEQNSGLFVTQVVSSCLGQQAPVALLSGPSFAADVARNLPTAVTLCAPQESVAQQLAEQLSSPQLRLYHTNDVRGVEIGGAVKNVLAIASGIVHGANLGASAQAALIARGFAEIRRFGQAYGAQAETLMGLSGLGDVILTCNSMQSRNFAYGHALGANKTLTHDGPLAEGVYTAQIVTKMAQDIRIEMPICTQVEAILSGRTRVQEAIEALMARPMRGEKDAPFSAITSSP